MLILGAAFKFRRIFGKAAGKVATFRTLTYVQSSLWPQKNIVCLLWSPKPSCLRPGTYWHSWLNVLTQVSKSWKRYWSKRFFEFFFLFGDFFFVQICSEVILSSVFIFKKNTNNSLEYIYSYFICTKTRYSLSLVMDPSTRNRFSVFWKYIGIIMG